MSAHVRFRRVLFTLLLVAFPITAASDDTANIYETVADVSIGPVFLTPSQREWLDRRRLMAPSGTAASSTSVAAGQAESETIEPAGYIVSSSGRRSEWSDGDFIESTSSAVTSVPFPGDVKLVRHDNDANDDKVEDGEDESQD